MTSMLRLGVGRYHVEEFLLLWWVVCNIPILVPGTDGGGVVVVLACFGTCNVGELFGEICLRLTGVDRIGVNAGLVRVDVDG